MSLNASENDKFIEEIMAKAPPFGVLRPNQREGHHQRRGERIERKTIEIGKAKCMDFITDSTLIECDIHIFCGTRSVNLFGSIFERCTFRPRREMKNLGFTSMVLRDCTFLGKYTGARFGRELAQQVVDIRRCDFSATRLFHLCDFVDGVDIESLRWPPWPHVVVTDLPRSRRSWLKLKLPEEMRLTQKVIGEEESLSKAVTIFLPAETERIEEVRELLESQSYIIIA